MAPRRIVAIVLPKLACEIAKSRAEVKGPLAVILEPTFTRPPLAPKVAQAGPSQTGPSQAAPSHGGSEASPASKRASVEQIALPGFEAAARTPAKESAVLGAACDEARRYGVRPGQKVSEATALVARLTILHVTFGEMDRALGHVAEVAMGFGTTAAVQLSRRAGAHAIDDRSPAGDGPFDTVWLDVTGAAHLAGGEESLLDELGERVAALGHAVHIAIADGPRIAQALARWGVSPKGHLIAAEGRGAEALAPLPVRALPLPSDIVAFLLRVGVLTVGDLARLPKVEALARLGTRGVEALAVATGFDPTPLVPFAPPPVLDEETLFDEGVQSVEPLLFVLRGTTSRLSARLEARGEACTRLDVELPYDVSIAKRVLAERGEAISDEALRERFHIDLPAQLVAAADLFRVLRTRLERTTLLAPVTSVRVTVSEIARARRPQLDFSRDTQADPNSLPALLAELSAEIGPERLGVLALCDAIRPEARTRLVPVTDVDAKTPSIVAPFAEPRNLLYPARLLKKPLPLGRAGSSVIAVTGQLYVVERRRFVARLDDIEWWTDQPCSRDYYRATLVSGTVEGKARPMLATAHTNASNNLRAVASEALVFVDPRTEETFLQGWFE